MSDLRVIPAKAGIQIKNRLYCYKRFFLYQAGRPTHKSTDVGEASGLTIGAKTSQQLSHCQWRRPLVQIQLS